MTDNKLKEEIMGILFILYPQENGVIGIKTTGGETTEEMADMWKEKIANKILSKFDFVIEEILPRKTVNCLLGKDWENGWNLCLSQIKQNWEERKK